QHEIAQEGQHGRPHFSGMAVGADQVGESACRHRAWTWAIMRARMAASGRRPRAAPRLSVMCSGLLVPGMTAVTVGLASRYLRKNCAQLLQSNSAAQSGN